MPLASDLSALKQRLDSYFWRNRSPEMQLLTDVLTNHFSHFQRIAVAGGLARDFAREGRTGFRSDVDLVIEASGGEVASVAQTLDAKPNRFGGYGVKIGAWKIDFWALETTWAVQNAGVTVSGIKDITRCTFFDWDAVAYDLRTRCVYCDPGYLDRLRGRSLEINLLATPSLEGNLMRAMRRLILWKLRPGPVLRQFIEDNLDGPTLKHIQGKEARLYPLAVSAIWSDKESARRALLEAHLADDQLHLALPNSIAESRPLARRLGRAKARRRPRHAASDRRLPGL